MVKRDRGRSGSSLGQTARLTPNDAADAIFSAADQKRQRGLKLIEQEGRVLVGSFRISAVGLEVTGDATRDEWMTLWDLLNNIKSAMQWLIGDWLAYGMDRQWGSTYEDFAEMTGYTTASLYNLTWVCQNVHFSRRRENLSFGHHQLVAGLTPADQDRWLEQADAHRWSIRQMKREMAAAPALPDPHAAMMDQIAAFLSQTRYRWERFTRRIPRMGQGDRQQISQIISQEIEYLEALQRQFETYEDS